VERLSAIICNPNSFSRNFPAEPSYVKLRLHLRCLSVSEQRCAGLNVFTPESLFVLTQLNSLMIQTCLCFQHLCNHSSSVMFVFRGLFTICRMPPCYLACPRVASSQIALRWYGLGLVWFLFSCGIWFSPFGASKCAPLFSTISFGPVPMGAGLVSSRPLMVWDFAWIGCSV